MNHENEEDLMVQVCVTRTLPPALTLELGLERLIEAVDNLFHKVLDGTKHLLLRFLSIHISKLLDDLGVALKPLFVASSNIKNSFQVTVDPLISCHLSSYCTAKSFDKE